MYLLSLLACSTPEPTPPPAEPVAITVCAASSLTDVFTAIGPDYTAKTGTPVTFAFDASSKIATRIKAGEPCDAFVSADQKWMDDLATNGKIDPLSRRDIVGNRLVVVVGSAAAYTPADAAGLADSQIVHLAIGGEGVPAGRYARDSLIASNVDVSAKFVEGDSVRTVLRWVSTGEAEAGIVYRTDAKVDPAVKVAFEFPDASHAPIIYPGAVVAGSAHAPGANAFLDFLTTDAHGKLTDAGFQVLLVAP